MKSFKKLAASIAALATAATLSVGTLAVTASEVKKAIDSQRVYTDAEEQFIASFENDKYTRVAEYLVDNDISLSEAESIMNQYVRAKEGNVEKNTKNKSLQQSINRSSAPNFYSTTVISPEQHYGAIISKTGTYNHSDVTWYLVYNRGSSCHHYVNPTSEYLDLRILLNFPNYTTISSGNIPGWGYGWVIDGPVSLTSSTNHAVSICDFPFYINSNTPNESALYGEFMLRDDSSGISNRDLLDYETYIRGDANHDGIINDIDLSIVIDYNLDGIDKIPTNYVGVSEEIARAVNMLGADADGNKYVELADITWLSRYLLNH